MFFRHFLAETLGSALMVGGAVQGGSPALENAVSVPHASFFNLFLEADIVVKLVMLLLVLASVWSWAVIFDKIFFLKSLKRKMGEFERIFSASQSLELLTKHVVRTKESHPFANILVAAIEEWGAQVKPHAQSVRDSTKERIYHAMQMAANKSIDDIDANVSILATIGTSSPFIGLFGTVWGIMVSFQSIAASKNTSLAVVAPGIAEALLATAFGLIAAIPAVIFYNKFSTEITKVANRVEDFKAELTTLILREL